MAPGPRLLHHLSLGVRDIERAAALYDAMLQPLGIVRVWSDLRPGEDGQAVGYGWPGGGDHLCLKQIGSPSDAPPDADAAATARPERAGFHLAFGAATRAAVDDFHRRARAAGARDNGGPGLRPHYGADYYAAFVVDLDGHRLEAVCRAAA